MIHRVIIGFFPAIFMCFFAGSVWGQDGSFIKVFGETGVDEGGTCVWQLDDGSIFLAGSKGEGPFGHNDIWVLKLNRQGEVIWERFFGTPDSDYPNDMVYHEGELIIGGESTNLLTIAKQGFVLALDTLGNETYFSLSGFPDKNVQFNSVIPAEDGFVACGFISGAAGFGNDIYVKKMSRNGLENWESVIGDLRNEVGNYVGRFANGNYVVTCDKQRPDGKYNVFAACLNNRGEVVWELDVPTIYNGGSKKLLINSAGNALMVGEMSTPSSSSFDMYLVEVTPDGEKVLETWVPATVNSDAAFGVCEPVPGNYLLTGYGYNPETDQTDIPVVSIDADGQLIDRRYYGLDRFDIAYDIEVSPNGGFLVVGSVQTQGDVQIMLISDRIRLASGLATDPDKATPILRCWRGGDGRSVQFSEILPMSEFRMVDAAGRSCWTLKTHGPIEQLTLPASLPHGVHFLTVLNQEGRKTCALPAF